MFDSIKKMVNKAGIGKPNIMKKYIDTFKKNKLDSDEELLVYAAPLAKPTELLFITDKRVFYYKMGTKDTSMDRMVDYKDIQSCEISTEDNHASIMIDTTSTTITMNRVAIDVAENVKQTVDNKLNEQ
ncbi:PH domain-containing protein [Aquibacillus saliphilus]|uniref:PH domain-containing protein n=1 Tax=Aquibacillus saliphilus TaxID=1909422 RepID=UPI001CF0C423|nr:PH domain-containing protein [Aquibacillus saliphilus]